MSRSILNARPENDSASPWLNLKVACSMPGATVKNRGGSPLTELTSSPFTARSIGTT